jgi:hexosaminidase
MPTNIVIQSWRGKEALVEAAKKGYQTILSNGYYIDLIQPTDFHYLLDPLPPDNELSSSEQKLILGGEATMWSEMVSEETIDSRIWPRTAAIAERLWSPQNIIDIDSMYARLGYVSYMLEEHGLTHIKNQEMMLRRLTGNQETEPLKNLISVIEPVKIYSRDQLRKQSQHTPLTRVVDTALPDSKEAREFRNTVERFISNTAESGEGSYIKGKLEFWKANHKRLLPIISQSPILFEIESLSDNLAKISEVGLVLLKIIAGEITAEEIWIEDATNIIAHAKIPVAQSELMVLPAIENLLNKIK